MILVDDIIAILNKWFETPMTLDIMATLYAVGCPMAWHKTDMATKNLWAGFNMELSKPIFKAAEEKIMLILMELMKWTEGKHASEKDIHITEARTQWATAACPTVKLYFFTTGMGLDGSCQNNWRKTAGNGETSGKTDH